MIVDAAGRGLFLNVESVKDVGNGLREFETRLFSERAYRPPGAIEPIAVENTWYEIDCKHALWREKRKVYLTDAGKAAGQAPRPSLVWNDIGSGSEMDGIYHKIC